jgi:hypothetical protein
MRSIQKLLAGGLLTIGLVFLLMVVLLTFQKERTQKDQDALLGGLLLGLPSTLAGSWIIWNLRAQRQRDRQIHLQKIFYKLLPENDGKISILQFAIASQVSGEEAKQYLDIKAQEFNANFNVVETTVVYEFGVIDPDPDDA